MVCPEGVWAKEMAVREPTSAVLRAGRLVERYDIRPNKPVGKERANNGKRQ